MEKKEIEELIKESIKKNLEITIFTRQEYSSYNDNKYYEIEIVATYSGIEICRNYDTIHL